MAACKLIGVVVLSTVLSLAESSWWFSNYLPSFPKLTNIPDVPGKEPAKVNPKGMDSSQQLLSREEVLDLEKVDPNDKEQMNQVLDYWAREYRRTYFNKGEEELSLRHLQETVIFIKEHNSNENRTYELGLNEFSDWSFEDVESKLTGYKEFGNDSLQNDTSGFFRGDLVSADELGDHLEPSSNSSDNSSSIQAESGVAPETGKDEGKKAIKSWFYGTPSSVDWTSKGYVTPVKYQGSCDACWAFSAVGALEGAYYRRRGQLLSFSEQELVDCGWPYTGCRGGQPYGAFNYVGRNGGLSLSASYPYVSQYGSYTYCKRSSNRLVYMSIYYYQVRPYDDEALVQALSTYGPISVTISIANGFQMYRSGIMDRSGCGYTLNHALLLTGYGTDYWTGIKYWKLKNSWGTQWGENGYIRLNRNQFNVCGITQAAIVVFVS